MGYKNKSKDELLQQFRKMQKRISSIDETSETAPVIKQAFQQQVQTDDGWDLALQHIPAVVVIIDRDFNVINVNRGDKGVTRKEAIGRNAFDFIDPDSHDIVRDKLTYTFETGLDCSFESHGQGPDNTMAWYRNKVGAIYEGEDVTKAIVIATDITEEKNKEAALEANKNILNTVQEMGQFGYWELNTHTKIMKWSDNLRTMLGLTQDLDPDPIRIREIMHPEDLPIFDKVMRDASILKDVTSVEFRAMVNGDYRFFSNNSGLVLDQSGEPTIVYGLILDITERSLADIELNKTKEFLQTIYDNSNLGLYVVDVVGPGDYRYLGCNKIHEFNMGVTNEEILGKSPDDLREILGDEAINYVYSLYDECIASGKTIESEILITVNNQEDWWQSRITPLMNGEGEVYQLIGNSIKITESRQIQKALAESEEKYRLLVDNQTDLIVKFNLEGKLLFASPSMSKMFNMGEGELIDFEFMSNVHKEDIEKAQQAVNSLHQPPHTSYVEERVKTPEGWRWLAWRNTAIMDNEGQVTGAIGIGRDVTERKLAEAALKDSEEHYRTIFEAASCGFILFDLEGKIIDANNAACRMHGYSRDELIACDPGQIIYEDSKREFYDFIEAVKNGREFHVEAKDVKSDGTIVNVRVYGVPYTHKGSKTALATILDETSQYEVEAALRKSEEHYRTIFDAASCGFLLVSMEGRVIDANSAICEMHGYTREEFVNLHPTEFIHEDYLQLFNECIESIRQDKEFYIDALHICANKEIINVRVYGVPYNFNGEKIVLGNILDMTPQNKAEKALRENEERLSLFLDNFTGVAYQTKIINDKDFEFILLRGAVESITGFSINSFLTDTEKWITMIVEEDRHAYRKSLCRLFDGDSLTADRTYRVQIESGEVRWVRDISQMITNGDDRFVHGTIYDITSRKKAEDELQKFKNISDKANYGTAIINPDGSIVYANECLARMHGMTVEEIQNKDTIMLHNEEQLPLVKELFKKLSETGSLDAEEVWRVKKDGTVFPSIINVAVNYDNDKNPKYYSATAIDISQLKRLEEEVVKAEKLDSIGVLAGGIAHDFNNILTAILGNVSLARFELTEDSELMNLMTEIEKATLRAKDLTHQLLTFSKGGTPITKSERIGQMIKETATFALSGSNVKPLFTIAGDLLPVEVDKGQISQAINNLTLNADQAMPDGGMILFNCQNIELTNESDIPLPEGMYVKVSIEDEGIGIAKKYLSRIFDPFFTTKQKGNGLGLASTYSIMKKHNGYISVASEIDEGTIFTIYLPATDKSPDLPADKSLPEIIGQGKILVVDDQESVLRLAKNILSRLGYTTVLVESGEKAVIEFQKALDNNEPFEVVILDLTIPGGMSGYETLKQIQTFCPDVKAIVSSGYSNDPIVSNYTEYGFLGCVDKPYKVRELALTLKSVFESD